MLSAVTMAGPVPLPAAAAPICGGGDERSAARDAALVDGAALPTSRTLTILAVALLRALVSALLSRGVVSALSLGVLRPLPPS